MNRVRAILRNCGAWLLSRRWWGVGLVAAVAVAISAPLAITTLAVRGKIYDWVHVPRSDVAIVFGAGVCPDGTPAPYLESRLLAAVRLYQTGKARVLLVSGDNRTAHYNEPRAMAAYIEARGVPSSAVVLDYAGYDTYDTCYRAHALFGVTSAILVSHAYHLPRALMTCDSLGIASVGVKAGRAGSTFSRNYLAREVLAVDKSVVQLLFKPRPAVLGPKEPGIQNALAGSD